MNAFTASIPRLPEHPLLSAPCSELLSLRIPKSLHKLLAEFAELQGTPIQYEAKQALAYTMHPLNGVHPVPQRVAYEEPVSVPLTEEEKAMEAFKNEYVIRAIQNVAKCIENGSIECTEEGILTHFISFIPEA